MESTFSRPAPTGRSSGTILPSRASTLAVHAEEPGHREAPDVGVEDADGEAPAGQGHGQVDGHRGLAHAALARGDGEHPGRGRDGGLGRVLRAFQRARLMTGPVRPASISPIGRRPRSRRGAPASRPRDVALELGPQRAAGDGQGDVDLDGPVGPDGHVARPSRDRRCCRPARGR